MVTNDNRIVATGYNGAPAGVASCLDLGCLVGDDSRCKRTIHAEVNAILSAMGNHLAGDRNLWITHNPCLECIKVAIASGISHIYYWNGSYGSKDQRDITTEFLSQTERLGYVSQIPVTFKESD